MIEKMIYNENLGPYLNADISDYHILNRNYQP